MQLSHLTPDTPRRPVRVSPDERVDLVLATAPVGAHQSVWIDYRVQAPRHGTTTLADPSDDRTVERRVQARWTHNEGDTSYWQAFLGPFPRGARVTYEPWATAPEGDAQAPAASFRVGTRLHVALLWHQHQPLYRDPDQPIGHGSYRQPWVRLHGIRDYYAMAHLVAEHPAVHVTINLTPVLLEQIDDYLERGATDRALDLTLARAEDLDDDATSEILSTFFDADWHQQIYPYDRYHALLDMRQAGRPLQAQDVRDLQMWFNLAWFAPEFHEGTVELPGGATASVRDLVLQGRDYRHEQLEAMVDEQYKILRAIVPIHRRLQDAGQIEVSTTPYYHPILPLLIDTDQATIDRPGTEHPPRFAYPEDARAQTAAAVEAYQDRFGRRPRGMWPAEGAVSEDAAAMFAEARVRWITSDQGVLQRSGRWGYRSDDPNVLCQPYRVVTPAGDVSIFFRDTALSNDIGFHYQGYSDAGAAARDFLRQIRERVAHRIDDPDHERVLTIALDGENAWGAYREAARPFLHALYTALEQADDLATVTFSECLDGVPERDLEGHRRPSPRPRPVHRLVDRRARIRARRGPQHLDRRGRGEPSLAPARRRTPRVGGREGDAALPSGRLSSPVRRGRQRLVLVARRHPGLGARRRLRRAVPCPPRPRLPRGRAYAAGRAPNRPHPRDARVDLHGPCEIPAGRCPAHGPDQLPGRPALALRRRPHLHHDAHAGRWCHGGRSPPRCRTRTVRRTGAPGVHFPVRPRRLPTLGGMLPARRTGRDGDASGTLTPAARSEREESSEAATHTRVDHRSAFTPA